MTYEVTAVDVIIASMFGLALTAVLTVAEAFMLSIPAIHLWNLAMPDVFTVRAITWSQALWLAMPLRSL